MRNPLLPRARDPLADQFRRGERSVLDLVAPASIEERRDRVVLDRESTRVLALIDYPRSVTPAWLGRLVDLDEPLDLAMHVDPLDSRDAVRHLTHRLTELESSRRYDARGGRIASAEREVAYQDVERLRDALERGEERVFGTTLYVRLHGRSGADLDRAQGRVESVLGGMMAGTRAALYEMWPGVLSCLPAARDFLGRRRNLDTSSLATMLPFTSSHLGSGAGILYGLNAHNGSLVILDPFSATRENANKVIVAESGAGKSYFSKLEALRALLVGVHYYVIDPEAEYGAICDLVGGQMVRLSGASAHAINPFDLPPPDPDTPRDGLAERILVLHGLLALMLADPGETLSQREKGVLDGALYETYARAGITDDPVTHGRPAPVLRALLAVLRESDEPYGLADRLARFVDGSLGRLFSQPTSAALNRPFVVFELAGLEEELRPLAIYLIADHVWRAVRRDPRPRMLLVDEAWTLLRHPEGAAFLAQMARQARKRHLGLTTVTQDVTDLTSSEAGRTVLANSSTQMVMRQDASMVRLAAETFALSAGEQEFLMACRRGEGLLITQGVHIPLRVEASPSEHEAATTNPAEVAARRTGAR